MSEQPAALRLLLLETVVAVAAEKNSTLVLPFPVELLRFLERARAGASPFSGAQRPGAGEGASVSSSQEPRVASLPPVEALRAAPQGITGQAPQRIAEQGSATSA